jgi:tetratricopeptide (TPR) repeat protein
MRTLLAPLPLSALVVSVLLCVLQPASAAEVRTFRKEIRQEIDGAMSRDDARMIAIARAKREALEEAGTYLESYSVVHNSNLEQDKIIALASGVLKTEILQEEEFREGGVRGMLVVTRIVVDTSVLDDRIRKLLVDREHLTRLETAQKRERALLAKIETLEAENSRLMQSGGGTPMQNRELGAAIADTATRLTAREWWDRGQALWDSNSASYEPAQHAIDYFTMTIELNSEFWEAYGARATAHKSLGQIEAAAIDLRQVIAGISQHLRMDREALSDSANFYNRGLAYAQLGEFAQAIEDFNQALRLEPKLAVAYYNRGFVYFGKREYEKAVEDFSESLRLDPKFAAAYNNRGTTYGALGQLERAITDFDRALQLDARMPGAYVGRGLAYMGLGNRAAACRDWRQAAELGHTKAQEEVQRECRAAMPSQ